MGKTKKELTIKKTPYTRNSKPQSTKDKKAIIKNKKPLTKSEKLKNADMTESLDSLMNDLTQHLAPKKKLTKIKNDNMEDPAKLEKEQRRFEKTQTDMDEALGLLTKL
ncbi:hypothetical protein BD408DRAFT_442126 [Parasitella parasitica]|nr:hypothetical protein BD408DRAFT_442126 [Parasitella parasitica]